MEELVLFRGRQLAGRFDDGAQPCYRKGFISILYLETYHKFIDGITDHFWQPDLLDQNNF